MRNPFLYALVFISGASVLAVEILGTRILGPFYGVSLFLWSALITVTLVALSAGYALGGRWADRGARLSRLCYLLAGAGLWLLLIPWLKHPVLAIAEPLGLRFAVLLAAFILFVPPLTLLGMISPYAIRLRAQSLNEVGRTAGDLYAVSTIGSVIAALLTGFFLIPNVGVNRLVLLIGALLILTAAAGLAAERKLKGAAMATLLLALGAIVASWLVVKDAAETGESVAAVKQSPYGEIRVVDADFGRHMLIDGGIHTIVDSQSFEPLFPYVHVLDITRHFFEKPGKMLLIGVGGGSVIKRFARKDWAIDAVEIDPVVTETAYQYFGLDSAAARVFHTDGRQFLIAHPETYDLVVMDAFGSSSIPFHLVTREVFGLIASRMNPGAVLAINVEALGWRDLIVRSLAATLKQHFSEVLALPLAEPPDRLGNLILLAANRKLELLWDLPPTLDRFSEDYHRNHAWDNRFAPDIRSAPVLSDDLNPVDLWSERINLAARKELHDYFKGEGVSW